MKTTRLTPAMAFLFVAAFLPFAASASTVETFSFTQSGYSFGKITGTFTGTLELDGSVQLADLTAFSANFGQTDYYSLQDLKLFSIMPSTHGPNSSLDLFASITTGVPGSICVGAAAAFGLCGQGGNISGEDHFRYAQNPFLFITTTQFAVVDLLPPAPPPTPTPEPSSLWLWGSGAGLLLIGRLRAGLPGRGKRRALLLLPGAGS